MRGNTKSRRKSSPRTATGGQGEVRDNFSHNGYQELKTAWYLHYHPGIDSLYAGHVDDFAVDARDDGLG
eukprot:8880055-Pyramimonas_sp.AAC.1